MKILAIQLARLGDIYQSWPGLRALKRMLPDAEIHVLARPRFMGAFEGLDAVSKVKVFPSQDILSAYGAGDVAATAAEGQILTPRDQLAVAKIENVVRDLEDESYDWIINLSFSPLSADLTSLLSGPDTKVSGYTRFDDGYLNLPDAMSAYFFAQVGHDRGNRFHLCEIFGTLCEVDLTPADWRAPVLPAVRTELPGEYIAVHVGGSESHKSISVSKWISILRHLRGLQPFKFVLIGGQEDADKGLQLQSVAPDGEVLNLAGQLSLLETMSVIANAKCLIGPDSAPIHMASLTGTPTLNLSVGQVNHYETGPRAAGSVVLKAASEDELMSNVIGDRFIEMVHGLRYPLGTIEVKPGTPSYTGSTTREANFVWDFMQAIYMGTQFPAVEESIFLEGIKQLADVNSFMLEQLEGVRTVEDLQNRNALLQRGEEVIETIAKLVPALAPLVRWYQTEKVRVGPQPLDRVLSRNIEIQRLLQGVIEIYKPGGAPATQPEKDAL